jgi:mRNA interferase RelE/StbE
MAWRIEFSADASREIDELDKQAARRIEKFLHERIAQLENPRSTGKALQAPLFGELWRYRVGDYRIICRIRDERLIVLVLGMRAP